MKKRTNTSRLEQEMYDPEDTEGMEKCYIFICEECGELQEHIDQGLMKKALKEHYYKRNWRINNINGKNLRIGCHESNKRIFIEHKE